MEEHAGVSGVPAAPWKAGLPGAVPQREGGF